MGTKVVTRWFPTDAYLKFSHEAFTDLEDEDENAIYREARSLASELQLSEGEKSMMEDRLRDLIYEDVNEHIGEYSIDDMDNWTLRIEWTHKEILVCEWCESPNCDGDPSECESTPEYCGGCEEYTGGTCGCEYCEDHDEWNCANDEHSDTVDVTEISGLLKSIGFNVLMVTDEGVQQVNGEEEETVL